MAYCKIYDTFRVIPNQIGGVAKDSLQADPDSFLKISVIATHAGRPTRNNGFYLPQKMREGVSSFMENYGKPFLVHHEERADPIGRVVGARYVDISNISLFSTDEATLFNKINDKNAPYLQQAFLVDKFLNIPIVKDPSFEGLGYIIVDAEITDFVAVKKVLDGRYLTVSIGATTDKAVCSICKRDWIAEGPCDHIPGKTYKDNLCVLIAGNLIYDEISFVNIPADNKARILSVNRDGVFDSYAFDARKEEIKDSNFSYEYCLKDHLGGKKMEKAKEAWEAIKVLVADKKEEDALVSLKVFLDTSFEENPYLDEAKELLATLEKASSPKADKANSDSKENTSQNSEDNKDPESAKDAKNSDDVNDAKGPPGKTPQDSGENDETVHYDEMFAFADELGMLDTEIADAKLSPEEREKMKKGTFCKPGERKYPVPDCAHAKVAMAYAKKNNESSSVIACIRRKAKALGCSFGKEKNSFESEIDDMLTSYFEEREDFVGDNKPANPTQEEFDTLKDQLRALRLELRDVYNEAFEDENLYLEALEEARGLIVKLTNQIAKVSGVDELQDEGKVQDLFAKATQICDSFDADKAADKLNDGMTNIPTEPVDDPTASPENSLKDNNDSSNKDTEMFAKIKNAYAQILEKSGISEADNYLKKLKSYGIIPADFNLESKEE